MVLEPFRTGGFMMRKVLVLVCVALLIVGVLAIAGCGFSTHTSMSGIVEEGWPADKAELDVVRISPLFGEVAYSEETGQYAFAVYDKSVKKESGDYEAIPVIVKRENIDFEPEIGDFISIEGELQDSEVGSANDNWYYNKSPMMIYATEVIKVEPPAGW